MKHDSSHSPVRVGWQAYTPGTWSAQVTGASTGGKEIPYVVTATYATDVTVAGGIAPAATIRRVEDQVIMPFYFLCDVSGSMAGDMPELAKGLEELHQGLLSEPLMFAPSGSGTRVRRPCSGSPTPTPAARTSAGNGSLPSRARRSGRRSQRWWR